MDAEFTKKLSDFLSLDYENQDVKAGALMLLQLNRNKILYNNIISRPDKFHDKLIYELKKHLAIRLEGYTMEEVGKLDREVKKTIIPALVEEEHKVKGYRSDHASLPEGVQSYFEQAHDLYLEMRSVHEKLKTMENEQPCDRFPFLKNLKMLADKRRQLYEKYDTWKEGDEVPSETEEDIQRNINSARSYISTTKQKVYKLLKGDDKSDVVIYLQRIKEKVQYLKKHDVEINDSTISELKSLGVDL